MTDPAQSFAVRLNSFASRAEAVWPGLGRKPNVFELAGRAATVRGLTHVDLNYPDQVPGDPATVGRAVRDLGLAVNGLAMRYYTEPAFRIGAFTNPDPRVRQAAIDLTRRGIDAARAAGADLMTVWLGQDGFDYAFQLDYGRAWDMLVDAFAAVTAHDPACRVSIEYKPNEPRSFSLLPDCATTLLLIADVGAANLGVTLDLAHVFYADEQPAFVASQVMRRSRLLGVHLNDGYGKRDDGLMVAAVHPLQTLELLMAVRADGYDGVLYFDTFPDFTGLDPVAECEANIETTLRLIAAADRLAADPALDRARLAQDAVSAHRLASRALFGDCP